MELLILFMILTEYLAIAAIFMTGAYIGFKLEELFSFIKDFEEVRK